MHCNTDCVFAFLEALPNTFVDVCSQTSKIIRKCQHFKTKLNKSLETKILFAEAEDEKHLSRHSFEDLRPSPKTVKDEIL
jgi:hypothetical protein